MDVGTFSGEESNDEDDGWEVNSIGADKDEIHEEVAETETPAADEIAMNQPCRSIAVRPMKSDIDEFCLQQRFNKQRQNKMEENTPLAHVITPPHPMVHSAVEVPDVDAIINTLRPHPVITSVEGRQWLLLPHTTIQIQGTPLLSLLDSGSEVTCINEEYFIALKARDTIHTLPVSTSRLVGAAGQQSSRIKWQALLDGATPASRPNSRGCTSPSSTRSQTTEEVWENWEDVFHAGDYVLLRESPISNAAKKVIAKIYPLYSGPYVIRECPYPNVYNSIRSPTRLQGKSKEYRSNREGTYGRPREAALMRMSAISTPQEILPQEGVTPHDTCVNRKKIVRKILAHMEEATSTSVSLLDAIRDLNKAWHLNVTAKTLAKCFKKARFAKIEGEIDNWDEEDDLPLAELHGFWASYQNVMKMEGVTFEEYVNVDDGVHIMVCVDFYGLLQTGRLGASYVFVVIDTFSKFLKLYPLRKATAKVAAKRLIENYAGYIKPKCVLSDHGTQFLSSIWENSLRAADIQPTLSSIRHPESNPSERVMRELGRIFRAYCRKSRQLGQPSEQHRRLLELRSTHQYRIFPMPLRQVYFRNEHHSPEKKFMPRSAKTYDITRTSVNEIKRNKVTSDTRTQQFAKFVPLYRGPYKIIAKPHPNTYQIADPVSNEIKRVYNMTNLKFYHRRDE
ncbi:hypothetical protein GEV33_004570 [Tenebrio molitor]|uniref:Integrase catalytic domain-containing protein n=1 Tax=Tenebrio molitor TaxID=7067 RepID=A0A8J6HMZ4_TENMO|nr:hypothetical protein GEV33_004570 [Tenebrio molitor]